MQHHREVLEQAYFNRASFLLCTDARRTLAAQRRRAKRLTG
jgi:hypothetical protein